jgi:hypothetical protein
MATTAVTAIVDEKLNQEASAVQETNFTWYEPGRTQISLGAEYYCRFLSFISTTVTAGF